MIFKATHAELSDVASLALKLWPNHTFDEFLQEFIDYINEPSSAVYVAQANDAIIGFAHVVLRHDYVEGTASSPVGYLEGIYIEEPYRNKGFASQLVKACEEWTIQQGCTESASDIEIDNDESYEFHLKNGFIEANRLICFSKKLV